MSNLQIDPYAFLQIDRNSGPDVVKKAYRALAKEYHPDKSRGNSEMFKILTHAYNQIMAKWGGTHATGDGQTTSIDRETPEIPNRGFDRDNFTHDRFNQHFRDSSRGNEHDFVYGVDDSTYKPRNIADYKRERDSVREDLDNTKPLFNRGMGFNRGVFNAMFEKLKKQQNGDGQLVPYEGEPRAMVSQNAIGFSNLNPHAETRWDIATGDLSKNYADLSGAGGGGGLDDGGFNHPHTLEQTEYNRMRDAPDPSKVGAMSRKDIKNRMGSYHNSKINIPRGSKPPTGDLDYEFDPYYAMPGGNNNPRITSGGDYQPRLQYNPNSNGAGGSNNRQEDLHNMAMNRMRQQPTQIAAYIPPESGGLGKPMTPQITYYRTQTTEQYLLPQNNQQRFRNGQNSQNNMGFRMNNNDNGGINEMNNRMGGRMQHEIVNNMNSAGQPEFYRQFDQGGIRTPNADGRMVPQSGMNNMRDGSEFSHMNYATPDMRPMSSSNGEKREAEMRMRSQFGTEEEGRMKEMEAELYQLRRKTRIQDKLIKRIKKSSMGGIESDNSRKAPLRPR